jgi:N4-gp56 family major capsid protein
MAHTLIKAEKVVALALGLLERESTLGALVWKDAAGDFKGAAGDTITIKLPAFVAANERVLRAGTSRTASNIIENKIAMTLDTDIYVDVVISDEELNLDITEFGTQVMTPVTNAITRKVEDKLAGLLETPVDGYGNALVYHTNLTHTLATDSAYETVVDAREALNKARVPKAGRFLVVGSTLESAILKDPLFVEADKSGTTATRTDATLGRIAGFDVYASDSIAPDEAYAAHKTAYALATRAPSVPQSVAWGAVGSFGGMAIRSVKAFDADAVADKLLSDTWIGVCAVTDAGHFDADGRFVPSATEVATSAVEVDGGTPTADSADVRRLVRAVKIVAA